MNKERQRESGRHLVSHKTKGMGGNGKRIRSVSSGWNHATGGNNETKVRWNGGGRIAGRTLTTQTTIRGLDTIPR